MIDVLCSRPCNRVQAAVGAVVVADVLLFRFHLWSCDLQNLKLTVKENICRTALNVMLRSEAKAQVLSRAPPSTTTTVELDYSPPPRPDTSCPGIFQVHWKRQQRGQLEARATRHSAPVQTRRRGEASQLFNGCCMLVAGGSGSARGAFV